MNKHFAAAQTVDTNCSNHSRNRPNRSRYRSNPSPQPLKSFAQPLKSLGAFHAGMQPPGVASLPEDATYTLDPPVPPIDYTPGSRVQGVLLGYFGPRDDAKLGRKHVLVVNLDYKTERTVLLTGPSPLDVFDTTTREWSPVNDSRVELRLAGGGGTLVRVHP